MSEAQFTEAEKSLKILYVVCQIEPTPTDWDEFRLAVHVVTEHIQHAVAAAKGSGLYWDSIRAIKCRDRYYLNEECTQELELTVAL